MHTGAGRNRSGRFATPCSGCVEQSCHVRVGLPTVGTLRRYHPSGRNGTAALLGRSGDTMISGWLTTCTRVQVVTALDALRYHAVGVLVVRGQTELVCRRSGRHRRHHPSGGRNGAVAQMVKLRRHHGLWDDLRLAHGVQVSCRSDNSSGLIPCGGCWLFVVQTGLGCRRSGRLRAHTKCQSWVGVYPEC